MRGAHCKWGHGRLFPQDGEKIYGGDVGALYPFSYAYLITKYKRGSLKQSLTSVVYTGKKTLTTQNSLIICFNFNLLLIYIIKWTLYLYQCLYV